MRNWVRIIYVSSIILAFIIAPGVAFAKKTTCKSFGDFFQHTVAFKHEPLLFTAAAYPGYTIAFHANLRTGAWTLAFITDGVKEVCTLSAGDSLQFASVRIS